MSKRDTPRGFAEPGASAGPGRPQVSAGVRIAPSPFVRDVLISGLTALLTMGSLVLVTGWLAAGLGPAAFAVYALSRRVVSLAAAVAPAPLALALARAQAGVLSERERDAYLWAGTLLGLLACVIFAAVGAAFPSFWARLLLTDARYAGVWLSILVMVAGTLVYSLVFAHLRGTSEIASANLWQLWALAVGPLIVVGLTASREPVTVILLLLAAVSLTALVPLVAWLARAVRRGIRPADVRLPLRALLRYSVPRVPGAAALACLSALGPFLAPYFGDLREAGYLVAAQSVLRVAELSTAGFGLVVLPKVSAMQARQQAHFLRERVEDLVGLVLHLGLFAACQLAIWAPEIVQAWLGPEYHDAVPVVRALLVALVPYLGFTLLRSVIDGIEERPVNVWNLYAALAFTTVLSLVSGLAGFGAVGLALASAGGFALAGALTVTFLWRTLGFSGANIHAGTAVAFNLAAGLLMLIARWLLPTRLGAGGMLVVVAVLAAGLLVGYLFALRRLRVRWVVEIEARLLRPGGSR
jgi:O-antigen/teichoic acid export membrane protein